MALLFTGSAVMVSFWFDSGQGGAAPNSDTMSMYLKLDEPSAGSAADSSGDGNDGTVTGATSSADVPATVFGNSNSLSFDGDDYAEIADDAGLDGPGVAISFWVKLDSTAGIQTMVAKWDVNHWQQYVVQQDGGELRFYTGDGSNISADSLVSSQTLSADVWYHVTASQNGTARSLSVMPEGGSPVTDSDTAGQAIGDSDIELTLGAKRINAGAYSEFLTGKLDDVRIYSRDLGVGEIADLQSGDHTSAEWQGTTSQDYEDADNWDIGYIPDPYTYVEVADTSNQPVMSADAGMAGLTIDAGARLSLNGWDLTINDSGSFVNNGTIQLKNSETLTGFSNDTDSGVVLLTPDADITGLKTGNTYNDLILNGSTSAHWAFDEDSDASPDDISGFGQELSAVGAPSYTTDVPAVSFANDNSAGFNGSSDYYSFEPVSVPDNSTWCGWIKQESGNGTVIGSVDQYALAVIGGNQVAVRNDADDETVSWNVSSLYNDWHHICITQADNMVSYSLELYVDGAVVGSPEVMTSGAGIISNIGFGDGMYFDGSIDDVRIYNRTLSPTEIGRLADGEQPELFTATQTLDNDLDVNGNLVISSSRLDVSTSNFDIYVAGNFSNDGGVFNGRNGEVILDGTDQSINSSMTFYDLTKNTTSAATLTFGKDSTTTVSNMLSLNGAAGELLSLRSSTPGTQWLLDPAGDETVSYLDVQDSNNISVDPVDITDDNVTDSGNNINWTVNVAPDTPASLGPSGLTDGSFTTDTMPVLDFSLADTNPGDLLRFQIQIDDDSGFGSPEVDYISDAGAHGARSYTVGQNGSDDTYVSGTDDMMLPTGDYYWRVKAIDDYSTPHESSYAVANGGSIAFRLDVSGPTTPGTPSTSSSQTERRPVWNWTASTDSGAGLADPTYTLQWSTDASFVGGVSAATTNNLTYTHSTNLADGQWYFRVRASDTLGNHSNWAVSSAHLIDNTGPTTPVAPFTASPTSITTPTWSWAEPTDAGSGLHPTQPYILNWSLTSNFSGTVYNTTSSTNAFTHGTSLGDGTWYMRVKAVDALGNESAWSANGSVLIDGSAPSLPGSPQTSDPTNDNTPAWTWDASIDGGAGLHSTPYTIQWSGASDFSPIAGNTTSTTNSYTHGTPLADGTWYIRVSARDALNNQSGYSTAGQTTIDTVAPDIPDAPSTTTPTNDDTPTWTWLVPGDTGVGLSGTPYSVEWSQDSGFETVEGSDTVAGNAFTQPTGLSEGTWYFRVSATDLAGNTSEFSDNGEVYIDVTPPTTPGDPSSADPVNEGTPTWTWLASTDSGIGLDDPAYAVEWSQDNTFGSGVSSGQINTNEFTNPVDLADGTWYFRVRAVDAVGNESAWSNPGSKVVDINPPTVPGMPSTPTPSADNTPEWSWAASTDSGVGLDEEPYMIEWSQDIDFLSGVTSDTVADSPFTHPDPLADGTWYFRLRAADDVGNISAYSPVGTVFVDAAAPSAPGTPSTTSPTIDDTPAWSWTASLDGAGTGLAEEGYIVEWSTASDLSVDMQSSTSQTNSFTHSISLADGTWYFRVRAVDAVGNESEDSAIASVEIDDTAPSVPGEPDTDTPTDNDTPTWTWSASTDNGVGLNNPAYEMQWSQDNTFGSGVFTGQTNTNSFTHSISLADGTWYFRVRAADSLGNTSSYSLAGIVLISTDGPSIPGTPNTSDPTTDITPTWTWTESTSDAGMASPPYMIEWSQDETFNTGVMSDESETNEFTHTDTLADGIWYMRIRAQDNTLIYSDYSAIGSVLVDTTSPSVPGEPGTTSPSGINTPTWTWTASSDNGSGLAVTPYLVEWSDDNFANVDGSDTSDTNSFTHSTGLADGTWYFRVRASDSLSNISADSSPGQVLIDTTAPSAPGTPSTTTPTADTTPTWTWAAASDPGGTGLGDPAYTVEWSDDNFANVDGSDTTDDTSYTHAAELTSGTWYFRVIATDAVGNSGPASATGNVVVDTAPPTTPGQPATTTPTADTTPTWTWAASSDALSGLAAEPYLVEWSDDGFSTVHGSGIASGASFTHTDDLAAGTWELRVRSVDALNNQSGWSAHGSVLIDTDAPSPPPAPSTVSPTSDDTPEWEWDEPADTGSGIDSYEVEWSDDNFANVDGSDTSDATTFTHADGLADGTWYFRVRAVDNVGLVSANSDVGTVQIDTAPPSTPGDPDTSDPVDDTTPTWTWSGSTDDGSGLAVEPYLVEWSDDNFDTVAGSSPSATTSFTHSVPLADGTWYFRVRAVDAVSNQSEWSSVGETDVDSHDPVISSVQAVPGSGGAIISWTTDEPATSYVEYGVPGNLTESMTLNDSPNETESHSVPVTPLPSCGTFQYRVRSTDKLGNDSEWSELSKFTTTACSGNAAVMEQTDGIIGAGGGNLSLNAGTADMGLAVPAGAVSADTSFQIKQISPAAALSVTGLPEGVSLVGSHVYDLKAISGISLTTSFDGQIAATVAYEAAEAAGFTASSLAIYRHDGLSWHKLSGCSVNTGSRLAACQTSGFSVFGLFGEKAEPVAPVGNTGGQGSEEPIPVGDGTVEPDPVPGVEADKPDSEDEGRIGDSSNDQRGLAAAFTKVKEFLSGRPAWWITSLLVIAASGLLFVIQHKRNGTSKKHYGIHKDE